MMTIVLQFRRHLILSIPYRFLCELMHKGLSPRQGAQFRIGSLLSFVNVLSKAICHPRLTREWLKFIDIFERKHGLPHALPYLVKKPFGIYVLYGLSIRQRFSIIRSHYSISVNVMPRSLFSSLWTDTNIILGDLIGKSGKIYRLMIQPARYCRKEGECSFTLIEAEDGFILAKITFVFMPLNDTTRDFAILIGGLQGPSAYFKGDRKRRIISATRDLSGLRPKSLVLIAVSTFAEATGAKSLHAVSNQTHVINSEAFYQRNRMRANYDTFWIEHKGTPDFYGFRLPLNGGSKSNRISYNEQRIRVADLVKALII